MKDKDISLKDRDMTLFENALKRPLSIQLAKRNVFLYNALNGGEGGCIGLWEHIPRRCLYFCLPESGGLLEALETIVTDRKYASFGLIRSGTRNFDLYVLYDRGGKNPQSLWVLSDILFPKCILLGRLTRKSLMTFKPSIMNCSVMIRRTYSPSLTSRLLI